MTTLESKIATARYHQTEQGKADLAAMGPIARLLWLFSEQRTFEQIWAGTEERTEQERIADRRAREDREAAARWREHNEAAKAAGCPCGRPATRVRRYGGTRGGVPCEFWSCDEHVNVNHWTSRGADGPWVPAGDFDAATEAWRVG